MKLNRKYQSCFFAVFVYVSICVQKFIFFRLCYETSLENYLLHRTKTKPNNWHENVGLQLHLTTLCVCFLFFSNILIISASHLMAALMPCHPKTIKENERKKYLIIEKEKKYLITYNYLSRFS
jgi:hypothetical protein